jgi:hypothetical protein
MQARVRFVLDGQTYDFTGSLMLPEAIAIEDATGWTQGEWEQQFQRGSARAVAAMVWILMRRKDAPGTPPFPEFTYDTGALEVIPLHEDGTPYDTEAINARVQELVADGMTVAGAAQKAREEEEERHKDRTQPAQPVDPPVAGTTGADEPQPSPSPEPPPATADSSPSTSASAPGSTST